MVLVGVQIKSEREFQTHHIQRANAKVAGESFQHVGGQLVRGGHSNGIHGATTNGPWTDRHPLHALVTKGRFQNPFGVNVLDARKAWSNSTHPFEEVHHRAIIRSLLHTQVQTNIHVEIIADGGVTRF